MRKGEEWYHKRVAQLLIVAGFASEGNVAVTHKLIVCPPTFVCDTARESQTMIIANRHDLPCSGRRRSSKSMEMAANLVSIPPSFSFSKSLERHCHKSGIPAGRPTGFFLPYRSARWQMESSLVKYAAGPFAEEGTHPYPYLPSWPLLLTRSYLSIYMERAIYSNYYHCNDDDYYYYSVNYYCPLDFVPCSVFTIRSSLQYNKKRNN